MWQLFLKNTPYVKRAKFVATLWTLLIFILCLIPGNELPEVNIPLVDKWTHVILFGIFAFLWLCTIPSRKPQVLFIVFIITVFLGWLVEYIQGHYTIGRSQDNMDILADAIGGAVGVAIFALLSLIAERKKANGKFS